MKYQYLTELNNLNYEFLSSPLMTFPFRISFYIQTNKKIIWGLAWGGLDQQLKNQVLLWVESVLEANAAISTNFSHHFCTGQASFCNRRALIKHNGNVHLFF